MLTQQNIESELSYAYLHAVASRAGFNCFATNRHLDNAAVDAIVSEDGSYLDPPRSQVASFQIQIQLKATIADPEESNGRFAYNLAIGQYDKLRNVNVAIPRFLVVLYLPRDPASWLAHTPDGLIARRCAYWLSLRNAPQVANTTTKTVYIPTSQHLSPDSLTELMKAVSRGEEVTYAG